MSRTKTIVLKKKRAELRLVLCGGNDKSDDR